ncbi:MAG TPA: SDR family NAD(P)-dependent oxidoreductase [Pyrinomonadaceae bacterium]|jgi:NAD(P)-dependent dehydrogenase (short-subunit alcohol dehydrogenase family)|nr:SDR family NAD(P)-dependent oxidoreductase [Pyrinomonadaceae bacterium]
MASLKGKVAVVAGATRGAGRGIARALGEAGATVYCTGRSVEGHPSPYGRPETIEETAGMVNESGGVGIAAQVDHTDEAQVRALFERVEREQGRLDVLADNVAGTDMRMAGWTSLCETDLTNGVAILENALFSHVITARYAAPLMIRRRRGLIVEVTEFDLLFCGGNILAQLVKFSLKGLAVMLAEDLRKHRVAAVAITPGYLRAEFMLEHFGVTEENWRDGAKKDANFLESESPLFIGRAVAALAQDRKVMERTGDITSSYELAREYGFTDYDGRRPDLIKHFAENVIPSMKWMRTGVERHVEWLEGIARRGRQYLGEERPARGGAAAAR